MLNGTFQVRPTKLWHFMCSVAGLVRSDYDTRSASEMNERTQALLKLSRALRWLSDTFAITVVVINQVFLKLLLHMPSKQGMIVILFRSLPV
jgi:hypothetical protein